MCAIFLFFIAGSTSRRNKGDPVFQFQTITYTTYSINYTYIVLVTNNTDTYTNYAYTTLRYMYYNTININLIYGWRVYVSMSYVLTL